MKEFDRHTIDIVARAVVSGNRGYGKRLDHVADAIAGLVTNRLEACEAPGAARARKRKKATLRLLDRRAIDALLQRVEKHLASLVLAKSVNGRP